MNMQINVFHHPATSSYFLRVPLVLPPEKRERRRNTVPQTHGVVRRSGSEHGTWFEGLDADGLSEVADDGVRVSVGEATHRRAVHLQQHVPVVRQRADVTHERVEVHVSEEGEEAMFSSSEQLDHGAELARASPRHGALTHFSRPVLLPLQRFGHAAPLRPSDQISFQQESGALLSAQHQRTDVQMLLLQPHHSLPSLAT